MSNEFVDKMVADALLQQMSQETKNEIVKGYIQTQIFPYGNMLDNTVRDPIRKYFADVIRIEAEKQISQKHDEIEKLVSEVINEEMADKTMLKAWLHKKLLEKAAKNILR